MVESAIITVLDKNDVSLGDFELPVKVTVRDLSSKMIAFLKAKDYDTYENLSALSIQHNGRVLDEEETLYENGIWDGSFLKIVFEEN